MKKSFWEIAGLIVVLLTLIIYSCSKVSGPRPGNIPPEIAFANIPPDSTTFSTRQTVYWFGKDADGYVAEYQYAAYMQQHG